MPLLIRELSLAMDLRETVSIVNADGPVVSDIEVVVLPETDQDTILPTGDVLAAKRWTVYLLDPNTAIEEGDVIVRASGLKLNITRVNHIQGEQTGNVMWLNVEEYL